MEIILNMKVQVLESIDGNDIKDACSLELCEEVDEVGSFVEDPLAVLIDVVDHKKVVN